jgi:23S rRNA (uracil1939-C5)-methyltransferase
MSKRQNKTRLPDQPVRVSIESLAHDGRGVARVDGKTVFVDGALPGEEVSFLYTRRARKHDEGRVSALHSVSVHRVEPKCAAFAICGGCSLQHLAPEQQILAKQQSLLDNLQRIDKVQPERVLDALTGPVWGYRNKARLGVKYVRKKGRVLVGFREKRAPYLADIARCEVLHAAVGPRLGELAELIQGMEARERIAQIEVAVGDDSAALVFRNLDPLSAADTETLVDYARHTGLHVYLQPAGPDSIELLWPGRSELCYRLADYDLTLRFLPTDFTQVNPAINPPMIRQALQLLELDPQHRVLDLFCGLGNFTLPMARHAAHVVGVEGEAALVQRARDNAAANGINNVDYHVVDLAGEVLRQPWMQGRYDRILLDPPRSGAADIVAQVGKLGAARIVYVACHPASLARDAGILVHELGYRLAAAGVMDMFPHTAHVESMAVFERQDG